MLESVGVVEHAYVAGAYVYAVIVRVGVNFVVFTPSQHQRRSAGSSASIHKERTPLDGRIQRLNERRFVGATGLKVIRHELGNG